MLLPVTFLMLLSVLAKHNATTEKDRTMNELRPKFKVGDYVRNNGANWRIQKVFKDRRGYWRYNIQGYQLFDFWPENKTLPYAD